MRNKDRFRSASPFSGVAGIELGVQEAMEATIYVESDEAAQAVLRKRMEDKHIPRGIIYNKVQDLDSEKLENIEAITAGFPCPDIGQAGAKQGLSGERSSLFRFVVRAVVHSRCKLLFLENVAHMISDEMKFVFLEILRFLLMLGFSTIKWGIMSAADAGSPQLRQRWFLLAVRANGDAVRLRDLVAPTSTEALKAMAGKPWNPKNTIPMHKWLVHELPKDQRESFNQLGNGVVPQCARTMLSWLANA